MNSRPLLVLFWLGAAACVSAQSRTVFDLTSWSTVGDISAGADPQVSLSAGARMIRRVPRLESQVTVITRPIFSRAPANWPILEVGPVAIVFAMINDQPQVVLVDGLAIPAVLPFVPTLDDQGRSKQTIALTVDPVSCRLQAVMDRESEDVAIAANDAAEILVVLTAGADQGWVVDHLTGAPFSGEVVGSSVIPGPPSIHPVTSPPVAGIFGKLSGISASEPAQVAMAGRPTVLPADKKPVSVGTGEMLQVFTPPAFRVGRTEAVRAAVARKPREVLP